MKVVIVEDEINAFEYLKSSLTKIIRDLEVVQHLESIKASVNFFQSNEDFDLIFMDIQIADGLSFEIFNHVTVKKPIIFTTAYDQYAVDAFKVHSVDYLLKPIHIDDLTKSIEKYRSLYKASSVDTSDKLLEMMSQLNKKKKNRCLVKKGGHFEYVSVTDIAYVVSEDSITFLHTFDGSRYMYAKTVEQLYEELDHDDFFQINRSQIVNCQAVSQIHPFLNQRLKLQLSHKGSDASDFIVSRKRMTEFKEWMDK